MATARGGTTDQAGSGRRVPVDHRRLPAAPLLEVVFSTARRRQQPVEELLSQVHLDRRRDTWLLNALQRAETTGQVTVRTGEHLCDVLGWHPRMVWGDTYDHTIADHTDHTAAALPGTATAWRQGCRCLDCREANRAAIARSTTRRPPAKAGERPA
jgi:hypothetical protein